MDRLMMISGILKSDLDDQIQALLLRTNGTFNILKSVFRAFDVVLKTSFSPAHIILIAYFCAIFAAILAYVSLVMANSSNYFSEENVSSRLVSGFFRLVSGVLLVEMMFLILLYVQEHVALKNVVVVFVLMTAVLVTALMIGLFL